MIGPKRKPGPKTDLLDRLMQQYNLTYRQARRASMIELQLNRCADDSARRILMDVGDRFKESHED